MSKFKSILMGKAFVEVYTEDSKFKRGMTKLEGRLKNFSKFATKAGGILAGAGGALAAGFIPAIKAASDMEETMNKFNVVFGESKKRVKDWSDAFANDIGRSKLQIADFMSSSQDLFVPLGFEAGAAENMSKEITKLSIDLASFNNLQDADVLRDLHAALTGSGEVMKKYGVIVSEAAVKQELLNQGLDPKTADNAAKVQARLNIILRGTTAAQGDAARSAGSFANQMKALKAAAADTKVAIGQALLPVITPLVGYAKEGAQAFQKWAEENPTLIKTLAGVAAGAVAVGGALMALGAASNMLAAGLAAVNTVSKLSAGNLGVLKSLGIAAIFAVAARAAFKASASVKTLNKELEKTTSLTNRLNQMDGTKLHRTLSKADSIDDTAERKKFLESKFKEAQNAAAANAVTVKTAEKNLKAAKASLLNKSVNAVYGSAAIELAKSELTDAESRYGNAKITEQTIGNALYDLGLSKKKRQAVAMPQAVIDAAKPEAGSNPIAGFFRDLDNKVKENPGDILKGRLDAVADIPSVLAGMVEKLRPAVESGKEQLTKADKKIQERESLNVGISEKQDAFLKGQGKNAAELAAKKTEKNTENAAKTLDDLLTLAKENGITIAAGKGF